MGSAARNTGAYTTPFTGAEIAAVKARIASTAIMYKVDIQYIYDKLWGVGHYHTYFDQVTLYDVGNYNGGSSSATRNSSTTGVNTAAFTLSDVCYASEVNKMNAAAGGWKNHTHTVDDYY